ncbi:VWA domain-containing protein [Thermomonas sp.]|uniref:VWA domain-containing protein n=1 Tax=Thermomonas sp. TaxID=1971895 RepID=UPI0024875650|nr:VWA domain-containing protein [Thermomonas sp.]MDI1251758.1 VWA domain-containing protein [Thermomonas sp.]
MNALLASIAQLHFLRPWWLLGLLLLPAIAWWWRVDAMRANPWQSNVDAHLLPHLLVGDVATSSRAWTRWLGLLAAVIAVLAMAGPAWQKDEQPLWQSKAPLVVALDLSSSILASDLPPSRLPQARAKLATLLRERAGGQVALVAYAGDAYTVAPLTEDAANVALFLDALSPDVMPEDGKRADRAIAWSRNLLQQAGFANGEILLLTDHADAAAVGVAAKAHLAGYRVSALGLGTAQGGTFDTGAGLGQARLDAASLQRLASSGGGSYQTLTVDDADLRALGVLDPQADSGAAARGEKIASWRDGGFWLLPLVMLLALPLFRRGAGMMAAGILVLAVLLPLSPVPARAQTGPAAQASAPQAQKAQVTGPSTSKLWKRSDQLDYAGMQQGIEAYREKNYKQAIEHFSDLHGADAQYNLGNALAQAGRLDDAIAAYDRALKLQPEMRDAVENRRAVEAARKRKPPPDGKSQQDKQKNSQQDKQQKPGQGEQQDKPQGKQDDKQQDQHGEGGQDSQPKQGQAQPGKQDQQVDPSKPGQSPSKQDAPQPQDAKSQADADAAQRKRMQEALGKQTPADKPGKQTKAQSETAEQRERRLANQAQLQRVPDDPGALLRARFRLEYQRRQQLDEGP